MDKFGHAWLPVVSLDQFQGFSSSWVSKSDHIVVHFHDGLMDEIIFRDINIAIASSDSILMCPFP